MNLETGQSAIQLKRPRCPYCHDDIRSGDEKSGCNQCMVWFHSECWSEHGGCTSCGKSVGKTSPSSQPQSRQGKAPKPTEDFVPLTAVKAKRSIHSADAYAAIPETERSAARSVGTKAGVTAVLIAAIPVCPILIYWKMYFPPDAYLGPVLFLTPIMAILIFLFVSGTSRQNELRKALRNAPENRSAPETLEDKKERAKKNERNRKRRRRKKK